MLFKWLRLAYRLWRIQRIKGRIDTDSLEWFALRQMRLMLDWYECQQTGVKANDIRELYNIGFQCHHRYPVGQGGSNHLSNLEIVTKEQHYKIHPWLDEQWKAQ